MICSAKRRLWILLSLSLGLSGLPATASDWPRFRGPNGSGVATGQDIPIEWSASSGILWKTALPGLGNSSPIVWGKSLFLQSSSADGRDRYLICMDTQDGKARWSRTVPGNKAHTHERNTLASSTPASDGERVYCLFWDGQEIALHAFDFAGNPVWNRNLGAFKSQHGAGASPILCDGKVILNNDQDGTAHLMAFDAKTGEPAWQLPRQAYRTCYSTPFVLERPGAESELIVASTAGITSYRPRDGKEHWHWTWNFEGMALRTVASPIYHQGMVFATSGDGSGARHMVAVTIGSGKPSLAWEKLKGTPYVPGLLASGEHVFYVNDRGIAGCFVARTGDDLWSERLGGDVTASPVLIDGKIYVLGEDGTVYVFPADTSFRLLAKNTLGENVMASPAVAGGKLFIRGQRHLFCIGKAPSASR